jgi:hypothetical protein
MPESFLVRANDKVGKPVMMVINPDSVTENTGMAPSSKKIVAIVTEWTTSRQPGAQ